MTKAEIAALAQAAFDLAIEANNTANIASYDLEDMEGVRDMNAAQQDAALRRLEQAVLLITQGHSFGAGTVLNLGLDQFSS